MVPFFLWKIWKSRIPLILVITLVWNKIQMSNLHQYESFELKKQPKHNLWSSCMVSILVGNGYCQRGCSGLIGGSTLLNCTDVMTAGIDSWSTVEVSFIHNFGTTEPYFEAL